MDASSWFMTPFWFKCRFFCNVVGLWRRYKYTADISAMLESWELRAICRGVDTAKIYIPQKMVAFSLPPSLLLLSQSFWKAFFLNTIVQLYDAYCNRMKVRRWVAPGVRCNVDQSDPISAAGAGHTRHTQSKPRVLIKKSDTSADTCSRDTLVHHSLNFEHKVSVWLFQLINIGSSLSRRHRDNFYKVWRHSLVSNWRNFAK